jgi:tetratricopeptide (TPR) repeat protein
MAMPALQDQYDEAMYVFSTGAYEEAIAKLSAVLAQEPEHFEAQLALGMAYYRQGDYARAIIEGHKAEQLRPKEQLVHTNLSLFYMKAGNRVVAEHHGLQARISSWRAEAQQAKAGPAPAADPELEMARPKAPTVPPPQKFPDMPWKKVKTEAHPAKAETHPAGTNPKPETAADGKTEPKAGSTPGE